MLATASTIICVMMVPYLYNFYKDPMRTVVGLPSLLLGALLSLLVPPDGLHSAEDDRVCLVLLWVMSRPGQAHGASPSRLASVPGTCCGMDAEGVTDSAVARTRRLLRQASSMTTTPMMSALMPGAVRSAAWPRKRRRTGLIHSESRTKWRQRTREMCSQTSCGDGLGPMGPAGPAARDNSGLDLRCGRY